MDIIQSTDKLSSLKTTKIGNIPLESEITELIRTLVDT